MTEFLIEYERQGRLAFFLPMWLIVADEKKEFSSIGEAYEYATDQAEKMSDLGKEKIKVHMIRLIRTTDKLRVKNE